MVVIGIIALLIGILLPTLNRAREQARSVACMSNLRQLALAATIYTNNHRGLFPIAYYSASEPPLVIAYNWDFNTITDTALGTRTSEPGLLWIGSKSAPVQQCPSFDGKSNTIADPYTGYNYNTSYLGHGSSELIKAPAKITQVKDSSRTALFGDGQYLNGANKYMRSPKRAPGEPLDTPRNAGTQGFRHLKKTNVAFVDGHVESLADRFTAGLLVAPGCGFLGDDNRLYDLD